jgi:hypothetical protein
MLKKRLLTFFFCILTIVTACLVAGCTSGQIKAVPATPAINIQESPATIVSPGITQLKNPYSNLTLNQEAELHAENLSLVFLVKDKTRNPGEQTVNFELSIKNVGNETVAGLQRKLSNLYAVDRSGKQYNVPSHVALIGLKPGETRSGTIEIANVPDDALPGLVFHYQFGNEEASWVIIPEILI